MMRKPVAVVCAVLLGLPVFSGTTGAQSPSPRNWSPGVQPGNMYLVTVGGEMMHGFPQTLMVAGNSRAEVMSMLEASHASWKKEQMVGKIPAYSDYIAAAFHFEQECVGAGWAAIIRIIGPQSQRWGSACGAQTPEGAMRAAARLCTQKGQGDCDAAANDEAYMVEIGHSGAKPWRSGPYDWWGGKRHVPYSRNLFLSALTASNETLDYSYNGRDQTTRNLQESIDKLGKACDYLSCYVTSTNLECLFKINPENGHRAQYKCVDSKFTASGYADSADPPKPKSKAREALDALYRVIK